jgi:hypothetical protein
MLFFAYITTVWWIKNRKSNYTDSRHILQGAHTPNFDTLYVRGKSEYDAAELIVGHLLDPTWPTEMLTRPDPVVKV